MIFNMVFLPHAERRLHPFVPTGVNLYDGQAPPQKGRPTTGRRMCGLNRAPCWHQQRRFRFLRRLADR
jgi:hypothetical protein